MQRRRQVQVEFRGVDADENVGARRQDALADTASQAEQPRQVA